MEQAYTRLHSDQARALGVKNAQPSIVIEANQQLCTTIRLVGFGRIVGLSVKQVSTDPLVPFKVELLKSKVPYTPDVDEPAGTTPNDDVTLYRIIPQQDQPVAGQPVEIEPGGAGYAFRNMDGGYANQERVVYLVIIPTGAGVQTHWDAAVTVVQDI